MIVTTWDTAPNYDTWGIDDYWNCDNWIQWHRLLLDKFGKQKAKVIWDYAYAQSGSLSSNLDCRSFNSTFKKYVSDNNLNPLANAGVFEPILGTANAVENIGSNLLKGLDSLTQGNTLKNIFSILLIGGVVVGGVYVYRNLKK